MRGFTESLRQELDIEKCGVSSLCVHPGGIRTNIAKAAKMSDSLNTLGMDPTKSIQNFDKLLRTPPEAARQILDAVLKNKRRLLIGSDAKILDAFQRLFPTGYQRASTIVTKLMK